MASRKSVWRSAQEQNADRWTFDDGNTRGKGKGRWECKACGHKVYHSLTPKDADNALKAHLREVRRHEATCTH